MIHDFAVCGVEGICSESPLNRHQIVEEGRDPYFPMPDCRHLEVYGCGPVWYVESTPQWNGGCVDLVGKKFRAVAGMVQKGGCGEGFRWHVFVNVYDGPGGHGPKDTGNEFGQMHGYFWREPFLLPPEEWTEIELRLEPGSGWARYQGTMPVDKVLGGVGMIGLLRVHTASQIVRMSDHGVLGLRYLGYE